MRQARVAQAVLSTASQPDEQTYYLGKLQAARYYFQWELPALAQQVSLLQSFDRTPFDMKDAWFQ